VKFEQVLLAADQHRDLAARREVDAAGDRGFQRA
jgi:hypothetical protein